MSKVSDVIEKGEAIPEPDEVVHYRIPGDASPLTLCGVDVWEDSTSVTERAGSSNCPACREAADEDEPRRAEPEPLNVTALISDSREIMLLLGVTEAADVLPELTRRLGAPEPQQADVSPLLDLVRQYGVEEYRHGSARSNPADGMEVVRRRAEAAQALFDRIAALVPQQPAPCARSHGLDNPCTCGDAQQPDPSVLSLPQVPDGAIGLVGKSGRSYPRQVDELSSRVWWQCGPNAVWSTGKLLDEDGPATVVMREPRTWPRLDTISNDLKAVRGASGKVYHRSHFSQSVPVFRERGNDGDPLTGPGHMFYALQTFDGPLTEVFDDEPGGEPR